MKNQKHLAPLTTDRINQLLARREKLLTKRDALYDNKRVDRIEAILAQVPDGQNNRIDLALGRPCAQLEPQSDNGATKCARNYTGVPTHKCTGGKFCKGDCKPRNKDHGALFAAAHSPELAADVEAVRSESPRDQLSAQQRAAFDDDYILEHWPLSSAACQIRRERSWIQAQSVTNEAAAPVAQRRVDDFLEWVKDQTADFAAHMAQYGAEMHDTPKDWRDLRGDLDI